eukprot:709342-Pleurochrysis_carterae.AAC.1
MCLSCGIACTTAITEYDSDNQSFIVGATSQDLRGNVPFSASSKLSVKMYRSEQSAGVCKEVEGCKLTVNLVESYFKHQWRTLKLDV